MKERICLGTVQFGIDYGINNKLGRPSKESVFAILDAARADSIGILDTAAVYGASEQLIGEYTNDSGHDFKIISKLRNLEVGELNVENMMRELDGTLKRLGVSRLYGYLLHDADMLRVPGVIDFMESAKVTGKVTKTGISAYHPEQVADFLETGVLDIIQIPMNILDTRFVRSGVVRECKEKGVEIHARSPLLQGLLMMPAEEAEKKIRGAGKWLVSLEDAVKKSNRQKLEYLIRYPLECLGADYVVIGVDCETQLREICRLIEDGDIFPEQCLETINMFKDVEEKIILPYLWQPEE